MFQFQKICNFLFWMLMKRIYAIIYSYTFHLFHSLAHWQCAFSRFCTYSRLKYHQLQTSATSSSSSSSSWVENDDVCLWRTRWSLFLLLMIQKKLHLQNTHTNMNGSIEWESLTNWGSFLRWINNILPICYCE